LKSLLTVSKKLTRISDPLQFGRSITVEEGSMVLRDASGVVVDSLNYGGLVDPWAAEGDQAASGARLSGCYVPAPGSVFDPWSTVVTPVATNTSAGRFPDGADTDSNCSDFLTQAVATLSATSPAGATNLKVTSMEGFRPARRSLLILMRILKPQSSLRLAQQAPLR
jgi:non-reducing end alpha-L-arabinofuranosidase